jgi:hypothetical protein
MAGTIRQRAAVIAGLSALFVLAVGTAGRAQVAFVPEVGFIPTGSTMTVTPAVTPDRRYVRLSVSAFFNELNGFTTLSVPAAVGGGFGGGFAGMNGVIGQGAGLGGGLMGQSSVAGAFGLTGQPLSGPFLPAPGIVRGDPLAAGQVVNRDAAGLLDPFAQRGGAIAGADWGVDAELNANGAQLGVRAGAERTSVSSHRRTSARKPAHRSTSAARRKSR